VVELLGRPHQADRPLLDQIQKGQALVAVLLRDRHHEPQVPFHHLLLRPVISALDPLRQLYLRCRRQQIQPANIRQELLQRLGELAGVRRLDGQPTDPSICSCINRFISTAYSSGSSLTIGSTKPATTIAEASARDSPRDMR
jgi:hypothetical protein